MPTPEPSQRLKDTVIWQAGRITTLEAENETLRSRLENLQAQFREHERFVEQANKKYRAAKENAKQWRAWYEEQLRRKRFEPRNGDSKTTPLPPSSLELTDTTDGETPRAPAREPLERLQLGALADGTEHDDAELPVDPTDRSCKDEIEPASSPIDRSASSSKRIASSQTTEGEADLPGNTQNPLVKREPSSDDEPEFVSARPVKRRKGSYAALRPVKIEPVTHETPIELRSQDFSSPNRHQLVRAETSDLDAVLNATNTPRKRKRVTDHVDRARSVDVLKQAPRLRHLASSSDGDSPVEDICHPVVKSEAKEYNAICTRDFAQAVLPKTPSNVLQPLSTNIKRSPGSSTTKRRRTGLAMLSEDGTDDSSQAIEPGKNENVKSKRKNPAADRRLENMLLAPTIDRQFLPRRRTPETARPIAPEPQLPRASRGANAIRPTPHRGPAQAPFEGHERSPPPVRPEDEPLRLRPLTMLGLEDFKINPKYMGSSFAFADSLRARAQKKCAPGCTKPECCGNAFKALVEMGALQASKSSDADVLQDYLGPQWDTIVGAYGPEKRRELLTKARAHALAAQHGKHRQAFERRSTPPGFWRTDMPSTQELMSDRAQAEELERQQVEARFREAMRPGGRWVFRDE